MAFSKRLSRWLNRTSKLVKALLQRLKLKKLVMPPPARCLRTSANSPFAQVQNATQFIAGWLDLLAGKSILGWWQSCTKHYRWMWRFQKLRGTSLIFASLPEMLGACGVTIFCPLSSRPRRGWQPGGDECLFPITLGRRMGCGGR